MLEVRTPSASLQIAVLGLLVAALGGCAALAPEQAALVGRVEDVRSTEAVPGEVQWTYVVVIENPGRQPAKLFREAVTLSWDGVFLSPEISSVDHVVPPRGDLRLRYESVFRRTEFAARQQTPVGRAPNAPQQSKGIWIYWQYLGRYESGGAIILNVDFFPERRS